MAGVQLSNLVNGSFNWQSIIDQLIKVDGAPVTTLQNEQSANNDKLTSFAQLKDGLTQLQTANTALKATGLFTGRVGTSATSGSGWVISPGNGAAVGSYNIAVSQLATSAQRAGTNDISTGLSSSSDVSGITLATMSTATAVTAGTFSVNGQTITTALTDSLAQVFQKISDATSGAVTASYNSSTDEITLANTDLTNTAEIVVGASNDTSNFLQVAQLANNGTGTISSSSALGSVALNAPLVSSRLRSAITAVDASGNGSFNINGVSIAYNINTDSLSTVLSRINTSKAGVTATYDSAADRVVLTNNTTGDTGLGANEASGGLLAALGLGSASTFQHGLNAQFTVNGGATRTSMSNELNATALGVAGLDVTVNSTDAQTISVTANTSAMQNAIQNFLSAYNTVQSFIDAQTKISTDASGTVTTATLSGNPEIQDLSDEMRNLAFNAVSGVSGTIKQLDNLGIDFDSTNSTLSIKDQTKLTAALTNNSDDVSAFFNTATSGFANEFDSFLTNALSKGGGLDTETTTLNSENASIVAQIAVLNTRLAAEKDSLTTAFLAMQNAQSVAAQESSLLTQTFTNSTSTTTTSASSTASSSS